MTKIMNTMDRDAEMALQPHLNSNERLRWTARPRTGIIFRTSDIFLIPFTVLWCGFAIFWTVSVAVGHAPFFFLVVGSFFVMVGLFMVFGRFILDARLRARTIYGITDERVILLSGLGSLSLKSFYIKALPGIEFTERADGSGSIYLGPRNQMQPFGNPMPFMTGQKHSPALDYISDVRRVYQLLVEIQRGQV